MDERPPAALAAAELPHTEEEDVMKQEGSVDVLVIGEALIDIVETATGAVEHVGGSPAHVALGLGRRGVDAALLTQLADDERGGRIVAHLGESGVRVLPESVSAAHTSTATATIVSGGGADYRFDIAWDAITGVRLPPAQWIHTGSLGVFLEPGGSWLLELLSRHEGVPITFDPNIRPRLLGAHAEVLARFEEVARLSSVVKLSDEDADWLFPGRSIDEVLDAILEMGPRLAAVTRGGEGAVLATAADRVRVDPVRVDVVDTIGAGDTFMASLIHAVLARGEAGYDAQALRSMGEAAGRAAAITVSRAGADLPWKDELESPVRERR